MTSLGRLLTDKYTSAAILILVSCACMTPAIGQTIRLTTGEWAPFISKDFKKGGVVLHIITDAFAEVGITVTYDFFPWARAKHMAKIGEYHGTAVWGVSSEREKYFYYSDLIMTSPYVLFHLKSYPLHWESWDDLAGIPMGGLLETNYGRDFKRLNEEGKMVVEWVTRDELNFRKLLAGRINFVPQELDVGYHIIHSTFKPEEAKFFTHHSRQDTTAYYHLLLSKKDEKNKELLFLFNKGLRRLRENGKYDAYFNDSRRGKYRREPQ